MEDHHKISSSNSSKPYDQINQRQSKVFSQHLQQNQYSQLNLLPQSSIQKFHQDKTLHYFKMIFSPKEMADSIKRRNENLEMLNFQNSDQEPDDIFNRRKKKVVDLMTKEEEQLQSLLNIKKEDEAKFVEIIDLLKFLCELKEKLIGARTEYYSNKTFCALKNSSSKQLSQLTKIMKRMYDNIINQSQQKDSQSQSTLSNHFNQRINQFLILPRFLISREKIIRFCKNQVLQNNLQFLISHKCLGHYNNQANKKMPEETQMIYVRNLLKKKQGREKFKKICSINHGNKFLKTHGKAYYQLYSKSMEYLKQLDAYLKKGKKYETVRKQLQKISQNDQISFENESSASLYNFKNLDACLSKMEKSNNQDEVQSEMKDELSEINIEKQEMMKIDVKRMLSLPQTQKKQPQRLRGFFVKKYQSMNNAKTTQNIILIPPPFNHEA